MCGVGKFWPRVSLRWIVVMLFVVSILAVWSRSAARQRHAVAVLKRAGAQVKYDSDLASSESIVARWRSAFAPNYLAKVTNVIAVDSKDVPSQDLIDALLDCRRLKSLGIHSRQRLAPLNAARRPRKYCHRACTSDFGCQFVPPCCPASLEEP